MDKLYSIMRDFLEVEYNQESLLHLLTATENAYTSDRLEDAKLAVNGAKYYLSSLQKDLKKAIGKLDLYIAEKAKTQ